MCVCLTATSGTAWPQAAIPPDAKRSASTALQPGDALREGINRYRRGEYEQATKYLNYAKPGSASLSDT
ncbi:MAG: hypothetical protein ACRDD1_06005, partial [Planctomycetia bacterium]